MEFLATRVSPVPTSILGNILTDFLGRRIGQNPW